jgi:hypothetical protein
MNTTHARVIIWEPEPRLTPVLRKHLPRYPLAEARSETLLLDLLHEFPLSFVVISGLAVPSRELITSLQSMKHAFPHSTLVTYSPPGISQWERYWYQAGIQYVMANLAELPTLKKLVRSHFRRLPAPAVPVAEAIWAKLPWKPK